MAIFDPSKLSQACEKETYTLDDAVKIARIVQKLIESYKFHVCIGGSCLTKGVSLKDIDLFIYPHNDNTTFTNEQNINNLINILTHNGFEPDKMYDKTSHTEPQDGSMVHVVTFMGKRVDFFFMERFKIKH